MKLGVGLITEMSEVKERVGFRKHLGSGLKPTN